MTNFCLASYGCYRRAGIWVGEQYMLSTRAFASRSFLLDVSRYVMILYDRTQSGGYHDHANLWEE